MDDLSGLEWSSTTSSQPSKPPPMNTPSPFNSYPVLRPTPSPQISGRNTPVSVQSSGNNAAGSSAFKALGAGTAASGAKSADSAFGNLMAGAMKTKAGGTAGLSMKEQQERLEAEKRRKMEEQRAQMANQFGHGQFWDSLGSRGSGTSSPGLSAPLQPQSMTATRTPSPGGPSPLSKQSSAQSDDLDDILAGFNADTKVDNSSWYPPPASKASAAPQASQPKIDLTRSDAWKTPANPKGTSLGDDDDPFGLATLKQTRAPEPAAPVSGDEDDDLLGDLARPVDEVRRKYQPPPGSEAPQSSSERQRPLREDADSSDSDQPTRSRKTGGGGDGRGESSDPFDRAVEQLTDLGFGEDDARRALTESGAGLNVQAAAGWLLDEAHRKAKEQSKQRSTRASPAPPRASSHTPVDMDGPRPGARGRASGNPAWIRENGSRDSSSQRKDGMIDAEDLARTAAAMGSNLLKTANSLWKTGQKKVQKAVADFQMQQDADPSQPKWMRSMAQAEKMHDDERHDEKGRSGFSDFTDDARVLDSGPRPGAGRPSRMRESVPSSRDQSPALSGPSTGRSTPAARWQQQQPSSSSASQPASLGARARLTRQALEDEAAQAYISPARRRKATPQPEPQQAPVEGDLLFSDGPEPSRPPQSSSSARQPTQAPSRTTTPSKSVAAVKPTPKPTRQMPPVSPAALEASTRHRLDGTSHFRRGDYAAAHASYSAALAQLPPTHLLSVLCLTNRALAALRTGDPRSAVADADQALTVIGEGKGEGEFVMVVTESAGLGAGGTSGQQEKRTDLKDLYAKALARKAEGLEQLERWADAAAVWQLAVESGLGGAPAAKGRERCLAATRPKPKPAPKPPAASRPAAAAATRRQPPTVSSGTSEAVQRLRAANAEAERADDEKFILSEKVDARIAAWRDGKRENLRALLSSLDKILWEGSGWKQVGLHELVVASKVKVVYMKAIAKVHPDKVRCCLSQ